MNEATFQHEMRKAETFMKLEQDPLKASYWKGFIRGLRKGYHGDRFGTEQEHSLFLDAVNSDDQDRQQIGKGYRDGLRKGE